MAGSLTNAGEALALNLLFRNTGTMPPAVYVGLATAAISDTDDLTTVTEEDDVDYTRMQVTFSTPADAGDGSSAIANDTLIEFPAYAANANAPVTYAFLTDASSGTTGTLISWMQLDETKQPSAGEKLTIPIGNFTAGLD